jgi:hypothetical protein
MADDIDITPGTGATVATDDVGGKHYQKIKVAIGADGAVDGLLEQPVTNAELRAAAVEVSDGGSSLTVDGSVSITGALPAGTNAIGSTKDGGAGWTSSFGVSGARVISADASGSDVAITAAPASGQKLVITDVLVSVPSALRVDLKEETSGTVLATAYLPDNGTWQFTPRGQFKLATADKRLMIGTSAAGTVTATAFYFSEA